MTEVADSSQLGSSEAGKLESAEAADSGQPTADSSGVEALLSEESTLPPVPEGVVEPRREAAASDRTLGESASDEGAEELRFVGSDVSAELEPLEPNWERAEQEPASLGEVLVQLADAAIEAEEGAAEPLTGSLLAQIFCRGDVEDERVAFLLLLLAQDEPVSGRLVLAALRAQGHEELVERALVTREELRRVGDLAVEQLSSGGWQAAPLSSPPLSSAPLSPAPLAAFGASPQVVAAEVSP